MTGVAGVGIQLQAMLLDRARESMAHAQASGAAPQPAAQTDVILQLSAAAQQLMTQPS
jgi:hypothetical protein